jgi:hypothetical protein
MIYSDAHNRSSSELVCLLQKSRIEKDTITDISPENQLRDTEDNDKEKSLLCKSCQYPIAKKNDRIKINEKNEYVFTNPHGYIFHIGCFSRAPGCIIYGEETTYFSWFSGYSWQIALCGRCTTLLGWFFHSKNTQFFGLILNKIYEKMK